METSEMSEIMKIAKKEKPNKVSGLVVKHLMEFILLFSFNLKSISHPKDLPIQFFCIIFTLLGHSFKVLSP